MRTPDSRRTLPTLVFAAFWLAGIPAPTAAEGGVTFHDVAAGDGAGVEFRRAPSATNAAFEAIKRDPPYDASKRLNTPLKARGAPGVALFDYDGDGDLDIYVANGPGAANSLYQNQLRETGEVTFHDVAIEAGVDATGQDTTGVCFGDVDNDGDPDLVALSHDSPNRLYENLGAGGDGVVTFRDVSEESGITAGGVHASSGCSFGDVNNDGLLDLAIGNSFDDWTSFRGILSDPFDFNEHNELYLNQGGNTFADVSETSGIRDLAGFPPDAAGAAGLTWAIAFADYDLDGDVDLFAADDQGGIPPARTGGVDRGLLHLFENDGTGRFTDVSVEADTNAYGSWMGFAFGDFDCDGTMDLFATNFGDYQPVGTPEPGAQPSRWLLGNPDGTFTDPGVGPLATTPFGWGTSAADYDNDGDVDVIFHGGHDVGPGVETSNDGVILRNPNCSAEFVRDGEALADSTDHRRRTVHGMAVGDLDENGFLDIVSVSNLDIPPEIPLQAHRSLGSPFDEVASFVITFEPDPVTGLLAWNGNEYADGTLSVELNQGENGNGSVSVELVGTVGLTRGGRANRDGIGAVVRFLPLGLGHPGTMKPVLGGSSYASQDALPVHFGLGDASRGHVEVLWPGGVRNRLYNVRAGERVTFPEIPCSFDAFDTQWGYLFCVTRALDELVQEGVLSEFERVRFLMSALRARRSVAGPLCPAGDGLTWDQEEAWILEAGGGALSGLPGGR